MLMRVSKSQRREHRYRQSRRLEPRALKVDVMSNSAEQKDSSESRILRFLRRLRNGWGIVFLAVLLSVYLTGFYRHSSPTGPVARIPEVRGEHNSEEPLALHSYLLGSAPSDYRDVLPGAIKSNTTTFEITSGEGKRRDTNTLPGAIGLEGSFDEHTDSTFPNTKNNDTKPKATPTSLSKPTMGSTLAINEKKEKETSNNPSGAKSDTLPLVKEYAPNGMVSTGEEKGSTTKRRKKKKKKKKQNKEKKVSQSGTGSDSSKTSTEKNGRRKKRKQRKKKVEEDRKTAEEAADSSSSQPRQSRTKSSRPDEKSKRIEDAGNAAPSNKESNDLNATSRTGKDPLENEESVFVFDGGRPMDRNMKELQVPGGTGSLDEGAIKGYYGKLVKAYLAPFKKGITRKTFFKVLRRRTYSLSPPGSNKGVQTILFQLIKNKLFLMDPYEVMKNSKPFYKTRVNELIWLFSEVGRGGRVPDTEFLVAIHDCVQTVNARHTYRGAVFMESNPTFTIVSCNFSDNIPIPMWEGDPVRGGLKSWDKKMEVYKSSDKTAWAQKKMQAVFRGGNRPSMFFKTKKDANKKCDDAGRSRLSFLGKKFPELFDVSVSGKWCGTPHSITPLSEADHHQYKYILYAEGNCFWADRLNKQVFGPSAIVKQETPCGQFWEPLLKPMTHYIPTDFFFQDTVDQIKWAKEHDEEIKNIVKNANEFAGNFLSEKGIKLYVEVLLMEYTKLLKDKVIEPEKGSREVTA